MYRLAATLSFTALACNPGGTFEGKLFNGMTGEALGDVRVLAKAEGTSDMTCQVREATSDATGTFKLEDTCADNTYTITLSVDSLLLADAPQIVGGQVSAGPVDLKAWRAPAGDGVYTLRADELKAVRTFADIERSKLDGTETEVVYPTKKPLRVPTVEAGSFLVISGKTNIDRLQFYPLISDTGTRSFGAGEFSIEGHDYAGVTFAKDGTPTAVEATVDSSKFKNVSGGERQVRYMPHDALPNGRYAMFGAKDRRMYVLDFGEAKAVPATAENGAAEDGAAE